MTTDQLTLPTRSNRILVVEDDQAVGDMLSMLLEAEGYDVMLVHTAPEALSVLLPKHGVSCNGSSMASSRTCESLPAIVLLDLQLPGMSGEAMIQQLSQLPKAAPPIIVLSAKRQAALEEAAAMKGVAAVLAKPFPIEELLDHIAVVLNR